MECLQDLCEYAVKTCVVASKQEIPQWGGWKYTLYLPIETVDGKPNGAMFYVFFTKSRQTVRAENEENKKRGIKEIIPFNKLHLITGYPLNQKKFDACKQLVGGSKPFVYNKNKPLKVIDPVELTNRFEIATEIIGDIVENI